MGRQLHDRDSCLDELDAGTSNSMGVVFPGLCQQIRTAGALICVGAMLFGRSTDARQFSDLTDNRRATRVNQWRGTMAAKRIRCCPSRSTLSLCRSDLDSCRGSVPRPSQSGSVFSRTGSCVRDAEFRRVIGLNLHLRGLELHGSAQSRDLTLSIGKRTATI
jgi:hypothetical protein